MIAIVGAGLTGLALAHELGKRGVEHTVFEATDRPGGVIRSGRVEGRVLEWGPQRGRMTADLAALVEELGLAGEVLYAPPGLPLYVYAAGALREVPLSVRTLVTGDLLTWRAKLRLALEPLTAPPGDEERVGALLSRKLGREAYERLLGPLYGGLYASDPADMVVGLSLRRTLRELGVGRSLLVPFVRRGAIDPPAAFSFDRGMQTLPDALHAAHAGQIRLGSPVRGLSRRGEGWALDLEDGLFEAETVVLTCPAPAAATLLAGPAPEAAARLRRLVYNPLVIVHLFADADLRGSGYQVALGEELATRGVTWNNSLFGRDGVYTSYLGGARAPDLVEDSDVRLAEIAVDEFRRVTGHAARPLSVARAAMPAWDVSWQALDGFQPPAGIRIAANWESRPGVPGRVHQATRLARELSRAG